MVIVVIVVAVMVTGDGVRVDGSDCCGVMAVVAVVAVMAIREIREKLEFLTKTHFVKMDFRARCDCRVMSRC